MKKKKIIKEEGPNINMDNNSINQAINTLNKLKSVGVNQIDKDKENNKETDKNQQNQQQQEPINNLQKDTSNVNVTEITHTLDTDISEENIQKQIDKTLYLLFNVTYFNDISNELYLDHKKNYKPISQMGESEYEELKNDFLRTPDSALLTFVYEIDNALESSNSNNDLYRILYKLEKYKFNRSFDESYKIQEKFGKFIIENENPKITKKELLEYLKRKK